MLWTAFILGLLGSLHCIGMCGPIAFMLPLDRKSRLKRWVQLLSYHVGRLFTYSFLGFLIGLAGSGVGLFGFQQKLSILIGLLMILLVLTPQKLLSRYQFSKPVYKLVGKVKNSMGAQMKKKDPGTFFSIGFLNGFLPCGLVYMAIFGALASGEALFGASYMLLFGLGTLPLMTAAVYLGNFMKAGWRQKVLKVIPIFVVIVGLLFVVRGLGLGVKYLSPSNKVAVEQIGAQYNCQ